MTFTLFMITTGFLIVLQSAIPSIMKKNIAFGVTIPEGHTDDSIIHSYRKAYTVIILGAGIIGLLSYFIWNLYNDLSEEQIVIAGTAIQFGLLFLTMILYFLFHTKTTKRKRDQQWGVGLKQLRIADLTSRAKDEMLPSVFYALPMVITAVLIGYTTIRYELMPNQVPFHWGANGQADSFTAKTPFTAISLLLILLVIQGMMLGINFYIKQSGIKLNAVKSNSSQIQQLASRKYTSWFLLFCSLLITALFGFLQLTIIHDNLAGSVLMQAMPFVIVVIIFLTTVIYTFKVGQNGSRIRATIEEKSLAGVTDVDEDRYWKAGVFYVNRNDPSIFTEKRFGIGWTINLGRPISYLILFVPIILILLITFYL